MRIVFTFVAPQCNRKAYLIAVRIYRTLEDTLTGIKAYLIVIDLNFVNLSSVFVTEFS